MNSSYLDYAASAPVPSEVLEEMLPWLRDGFGNPSSVHAAGRRARHAVEEARERVSAHLGVRSEEVIFTSGGTESNAMALLGWSGQKALLTSRAEHDAVLKPARRLEAAGWSVARLETDAHGSVSVDSVTPWLASDGLASFMLVNNETGARNPIAQIAERCHRSGGALHTDATQAPAFTDLDVSALGVDMLTLSGHKIGGPKGVGLLVVRAGTTWAPTNTGGGQERERRGGTENVAGIVGMAAAMDFQARRGPARGDGLRDLTTVLLDGLNARLGSVLSVNSPRDGAPHIVHVSFPDIAPGEGGEMLILGLDLEGVMVSAGSACSSGSLHASHVLDAIGKGHEAAIRYSIGADTTTEDVERAVAATERVVDRVLAAR